MRSILILLGSAVLLVGGFFVYFSLQISTVPAQQRGAQDRAAVAGGGGGASARPPVDGAPSTAPTEPGGPVAGAGEDVWVKSYDEKTGQVAFQFRASRYDPQEDRSVIVQDPQAELFMGDDDDGDGGGRQLVRIEGRSGVVVMATDAAYRGEIRGRESAAPRRGILHDVVITLYDESDRQTPLMRCRVNNIAFDNDTYRIATEGYDDAATGGHVPGDQVRVEVRGEDFDFDGRGLTIRWNEADRRLQLLEVAHGESFVIKSPRLLGALQPPAAPRPQQQSRGAPREPGVRSTDVVLATFQQEAADDSAPARPDAAAGPARPAPVYRANFLDAVRVTQGEQQLASADQMHVDFISDGDEPVSTGRRDDPAEKSNRDGPAGSPDADRPKAAMPSQPAPVPVIVKWAGKLRVTALEGDVPRPAPGSINIGMSGSEQPVALNYHGMDVRCAAFDYRSGDDSLAVTSSESVPLIMLKTSDGTTVHTPSIVYRGLDSTATLRGASRADIPLDSRDSADGRPQVMQTLWQDSCVLTLLRTADDELSVDRAALQGDVRVLHPQLALRADTLDLGLGRDQDAALTMEELKADGAVRCKLTDADGATRNVACDHLTASADPARRGRMTIVADGSVHTSGDDHDLMAGRVTLVFVPATGEAPAEEGAPPLERAGPGMLGGGGDKFALESILAQQAVELKLPDGGSASGEQLKLDITPEGTSADLLGRPVAVLSDGQNTLRGPHIKFEESSQQVRVHGPGTLQGVLEGDASAGAGGAERPVLLEWKSGLSFDGAQNRAELTGGVNVTSDEPDGTQLSLSAERLMLELEDAPMPAAAQAGAGAAQPPAAEAARPALDQFDIVGEKIWRTVTLVGSAQVQSLRVGADSSQVRRTTLLAPEVRYDLQTGHALVPSAGRILLQDTIPPAEGERPEQLAAANGQPRLGSFRGATAIEWQDQLEYLPQERRAILTGRVAVVHQDADRGSRPLRLDAGRAVLQFADAPRAVAATTGPATVDLSGLDLASLTADGGVRVALPRVAIEAAEAVYDASRELLTARGTDRQPVQLYDEQGVSQGSFREIVWDARSEQIQRMRDVRAQVRG